MRFSSEAVVITFPAIVKAAQAPNGKRMLEVCASVEVPDLEGDVITQKALLDAAPDFIRNGAIDLEHMSELGTKYGIRNPESYIVGKPLEVKDIGRGSTSVIAEIFRSPDGIVNVEKNRYDSIWEAIRTGARYRASVFGYPVEDGVIDCRDQVCDSGAKRFHITKLLWKSLALTKSPICNAISGHATIISAKSFMAQLLAQKGGGAETYPWAMYMSETQPPQPLHVPAQSNTANTNANNRPAGMGTVPPMGTITAPDIAQAQSGAPGLPASTGVHQPVFPGEFKDMDTTTQPATFPAVACAMPRNLSDAIGQWHTHMADKCEHCAGGKSTLGMIKHFTECCGMPADMAELFGHAVMHSLLLRGRRV